MSQAGEDRVPATAPGVAPTVFSRVLQELARAPEAETGAAWDASLRPGLVIGRFKLIREIGRGGFGVVWEARDRDLGRAVAFKAVGAGKKADLREERLLREAEAVARLSHPNIVTLHDIGRSEPGPYLILELLRGETLAQRLDRGPLPVTEALRIALEVAKGLAHAHAGGVVHRDLTPGNVFLCEDGQVKVLDLGMAHAFGCRKLDGGTPGFMAPEQWKGAPEDERTDVFALGVILYRMLANELPFPDDVGKSVQKKTPAPLDVPGALGALVMKMLARDPVDRPRDGGEVLEALLPLQRDLDRTLPAGDASRPVRARERRPTPRRIGVLVATGALLATSMGVLALRQRAAGAVAPSVAVLPFADMSPQHDQEYFSDGIAEEILDALARVDGLRVVGRTSSFSFKGKSEDLRTIGKKLGVAAVLEGSVRKDGNRVRVTAQLVKVADGYRVWSETYDRELTGTFAVQDEITSSVIQALRVKLLPGRLAVARQRQPSSPDAYNYYLLGRQFFAQATDDSARRAVEAYEKALALDPGYAPAWSALATQLFNLAFDVSVGAWAGPETPSAAKAMWQRSLEAAEKAVALDPDLAEGYSARGLLRVFLNWDWQGAQDDLDRALALAPGDAHVQRRYGLLLAIRGRSEEATEALRKAAESDALFPANWLHLGRYYLATGRVPLARSAFERALEIAPGMDVNFDLALLALFEGRPAAALADFERNRHEMSRLSGTALAQHALGHARESRQALVALIRKYGDKSPALVAGVYSWLGERDPVFEWLDRAYAMHDPGLVGIRAKEALCGRLPLMFALRDQLRDDPRYKAFLRKMNLPLD